MKKEATFSCLFFVILLSFGRRVFRNTCSERCGPCRRSRQAADEQQQPRRKGHAALRLPPWHDGSLPAVHAASLRFSQPMQAAPPSCPAAVYRGIHPLLPLRAHAFSFLEAVCTTAYPRHAQPKLHSSTVSTGLSTISSTANRAISRTFFKLSTLSTTYPQLSSTLSTGVDNPVDNKKQPRRTVYTCCENV